MLSSYSLSAIEVIGFAQLQHLVKKLRCVIISILFSTQEKPKIGRSLQSNIQLL